MVLNNEEPAPKDVHYRTDDLEEERSIAETHGIQKPSLPVKKAIQKQPWKICKDILLWVFGYLWILTDHHQNVLGLCQHGNDRNKGHGQDESASVEVDAALSKVFGSASLRDQSLESAIESKAYGEATHILQHITHSNPCKFSRVVKMPHKNQIRNFLWHRHGHAKYSWYCHFYDDQGFLGVCFILGCFSGAISLATFETLLIIGLSAVSSLGFCSACWSQWFVERICRIQFINWRRSGCSNLDGDWGVFLFSDLL